MRFSKSSAFAAASLPIAFAQTFTTCNPTEKTCPNDTGLNAATFSTDFTAGPSANASWSAAANTFINYDSQGAGFSISKVGQAPTIQTDFFIFFGRVDVKMKAAPGTGIVSSIVFESDDLDEIDWEFLGGNTAQVETNFFGKGNTTLFDRAIYYQVSSPQTEFHTYTVDWNSDRIEWIIDGTTVRTLAFDDPLTNGGTDYPQTPMRLKLGNWAGGGPGEPQGTVQWAGGNVDFSAGPFDMIVESVNIQNFNPADSYEFTDQSGSWQSIKVIKDGNAASPSGGSGVSHTSVASTATSAPTSSHHVANVMPTAAVVSKTVPGSSQKTDDAVPASTLTTTAGSSATGNTSTISSQPTTTAGTSGASAKHLATGAALVSTLLFAFMML